MQVIPNFFIFFKPFNIQIFAVIRYFLGEISFTKVFLSWFFPFNRCSHRRCSVKKGVLKSFANFTGKHLWWSLFLIKLEAFRPVSLLKRLQYRCFPANDCFYIKQFYVIFIMKKIAFYKGVQDNCPCGKLPPG